MLKRCFFISVCMVMPLYLMVLMAGCAGKQTQKTVMMEVNSEPSGALCTLHYQEEESIGSGVTVIGNTPVKNQVSLSNDTGMWLKVEKKGFVPVIQKIVPGRAVKLSETMIPAGDGECPGKGDHRPSDSNKILVIMPEVEVIARGTFDNEVSEQENERAGKLIGEALIRELDKTATSSLLGQAVSRSYPLKALWRDSRTVMEIVDPVRLPYSMCPVLLETASGRKSAMNIGKEYQAAAVLLVSGKMDYEKSTLVVSKAGLHVMGTAASFAGGYGRAMSNHQSMFTYTVYIPQAIQGTILKAVLVDAVNGEVLWVNKGVWDTSSFSDSEKIQEMAGDLLSNLIWNPAE